MRITKDAERQVRGGHPWVYDGSATSVTPSGGVGGDGAAGDLAVLFDAKRRFFAIGLYDPASPIRVKVLHQGRPATIDRHWWRNRLSEALVLRRPLVDDPDTTGYRWVHGENDRMPGLVLDRYGETVVLKLYSAAWFPYLNEIVEVISDLASPEAVVLRLARNVQRDRDLPDGVTDQTMLVGDEPTAPVPFLEHGLRFEADVIRGQKTGHFLDQRDNRARVGALSAGRAVLDVFACTGGFSVHAAAGGATAVHSVDVSPGAIEAARRNMLANTDRELVVACRHTTVVSDAEEEMRRLARDRRQFGLVVVDPPSFASRQDQRAGALRAYFRLAEQALGLVEPGGVVVLASCSSRITADEHADVVFAAAARRGCTLRSVERTAHPLDHPVSFAEGAYLKAVLATVDTPTRRRSGPAR